MTQSMAEFLAKHQRPAAPGVGSLLREHRLRRGLSQAQLAERVTSTLDISLSSSYVSRLESGDRYPPPREIVSAIAAALDLTMCETFVLHATADYFWAPELTNEQLERVWERIAAELLEGAAA